MHAACVTLTMAEIKGVSQFMNRLFYHPPAKRFPNAHSKAFIQTVGRNYAGFSAQLCFSVNMRQNGDKKVHTGNPKYFDGPGRCHVGKFFEDRCGTMLIAG